MHDLLKKNQKKFLAVVMIFLMISFLGTMSPSSGKRSRGIPIGKIGKTPVYVDEARQAQAEWGMLNASYSLSLTQASFMGGRQQFIPPTAKLGNAIANQIKDHPEMFLLLVKEAEGRGIAVPDDIVETVLKNEIKVPRVPTPDDAFKLAVKHFLMVQILRDQVVSNGARFTEPMWKHDVADYGQAVTLNLVEFTTDQLKFLTTAPTTQQIETLFEQYKHVPPVEGAKLPSDAIAFGYEVPNRVKLQYLQVSKAQILDAVKTEKSDYDREVEARMYYLRNASQFVRPSPPATAPATQPTSMASTQPSTQSVASTQPAPSTQASNTPTTRPFAEVKDEILDTILKPAVELKQKQVAEALHARLMEDYQAYRRSHPVGSPATSPTSAPATAGGASAATQPAAYDTYAYLEGVALDIQLQFNVLPRVRQIAEWEDASQLAKEPGIGFSTGTRSTFAEYATQNAAATNADLSKNGLQVWQPSEVLNDFDKNSYIFRLTDISPAHPPELADVRPRVEADVITKTAYESANAAASKFVESAKRDGFSRAALDDRRAITTTGVFRPRSFVESLPNFKSSPEATAALVAKARDLLAEASPTNLHPMAILPMPGERKVIVAQLGDTFLTAPESNLFVQKLETSREAESFANEPLADAYFAFKAVSARMDYHATEASKDPGS